MKKFGKKPSKKITGPKASSDNIARFLDHGIDIEGRTIHLFKEIELDSSSMVIMGIQIMVRKNKTKPIHIFINTEGGCFYSSIAIYDFIVSCTETPIYTYNMGQCMSAGATIFMAGDKRFMYKNSVFMLHSVSTVADGKAFHIKGESEECEKIFDQMCQIYSDASNMTKKQWKQTLKYVDKYYRSEAALELKIVEKVIDSYYTDYFEEN
jgi:ATP-dependent Clp protease protease subunit